MVYHPVLASSSLGSSDLSVRCSPNSLTWGQWTTCTAKVTDSSSSVLFLFNSGTAGEQEGGKLFDPSTCNAQNPTCQLPENCSTFLSPLVVSCGAAVRCIIVNFQCSIDFSLIGRSCTIGHTGACAQDVSVLATTSVPPAPCQYPDPINVASYLDFLSCAFPNTKSVPIPPFLQSNSWISSAMSAVPAWGKVSFQDPVKFWGGPIQNNQLDYLIFWLPSSGCSGSWPACTNSSGFVFDNPQLEKADGYPCGLSSPGVPPACSTASDSNYENLIVQYFADIGDSQYYHNIVDQYGIGQPVGCCPHLGAETPPQGFTGGPGWVVDNRTLFPSGRGSRNNPLYNGDFYQEIENWKSSFDGSQEGTPANLDTEFFIFLPYTVYGCYGVNVPGDTVGFHISGLGSSLDALGCSFDASQPVNGFGDCGHGCSNAFHSFIPSSRSCSNSFVDICVNLGHHDGTELPFATFYDQGTPYGFAQSMLAPACQGIQIPTVSDDTPAYYATGPSMGSGICNVNYLNGTANGAFFADAVIPSVAHEQFETITNPLPFGIGFPGASGSGFSNDGSWFQSDIAWDQSNVGCLGSLTDTGNTCPPNFAPDMNAVGAAALGEIGDLCKPTATAAGPDSSILDNIGLDFANVLLGGHKYLVYDIWSNSAGGCTLGPLAGSPQAALVVGTVAPNPVVTGNDVSFYVGIQSINGLSGQVNVTIGIASGPIGGTDPTLSPTSLSILLSSGSQTRFLLTLSTGPSTTPGVYTVQIDAVTLADSSNPGTTAWTTVNIAVTEPTCTGTRTGICVLNPFTYVVTNSGSVPGSTLPGSPGVRQINALCRSDDFPTGGGYDGGAVLIANASMPIMSLGPIPTPSGWSASFVNEGSTSETGTAFVVCMSSPILSTYSRSQSISVPPPSVGKFSSVGVSLAPCDRGDFSTGGGFEVSGDISQLRTNWSTPDLGNSEPVGWSAEFQNLGAGGGTGTSLRAASLAVCMHTTYSLSTYSKSIAQTVYSGLNPRSISTCGANDFATGGGFNFTSTAFDSVTAPRTLSQDLQLPIGWNSEVVVPAGYSTIVATVVCMKPTYEPGSYVNLSCGIASLLVGSQRTCTVTVTGTGPARSILQIPTGEVSFDSSVGTFTPSSSCSLTGILGSSSCSVFFTTGPSSLGDLIVHASYSGDAIFPSGKTNATLQVFDYNLILTPIKGAIPRGGLISYDISANLGSGSTGQPTTLDVVVVGLPTDAIMSGPPTLEVPGTTTLTIQTGTTSLGNYTLNVSASFSEYHCTIFHVCSFETGSRSSTATLQIYDFSLAASGSITTSPSVAAVSTISITPQNGFDGAVTLDKSINAPGLTCILASATLSKGSGSTTLSCSGSPGEYIVTVTAMSGSLSHSIPVSVTVTSIQPTPPAPEASILGVPLAFFYGIIAALIILAAVSVSLALRSHKRTSQMQVADTAGKPPSWS